MNSEPLSSSSSPITPTHPFACARGLLEIIPNKIDVEEESRLYDELCTDDDDPLRHGAIPVRPRSPPGAPSVFSRESIWLGDNSGESLAFARDVKISGWTNVGDKLGGAYVVYDCVIKTKEGTVIHCHKRYSSFVQLESALRRTLPRNQQHFLPRLPPKAPLARYRPAFLDQRRRMLQYWLSSILLHPDIGGCKAVRLWVMD
ncbi:Phox homologous domain-containing protein [Armillaria luteobubalina]|uniref:Endosomal/vacuolar adapter protein YPT35 n=1 Tax=Armillaria luteobubalina TaxID=153913 RepID=A0AA39UUW4_9AGAR|nr:Phox homologous domain-containing protein [Armillaria luteobubalina]